MKRISVSSSGKL